MLAKRVVTFFKNESKEFLKYTVNHFKKENVPVRTVYNIITRYIQQIIYQKLAPENIKFIQKQKFEPHLLVWLAISTQRIFNPYIHRSKIAIREEIYLKQCIRGRLFPFIKKHHQNDNILFWLDLASSHYAYSVLRCLESNNLPYVRRSQNPPDVPQCRPIENIWALIEQMVYQGGWEAKNLDQSANRIKSKIKQLIRSNSGDNHGSGCPRKDFENVLTKCLLHLLNFLLLSIFHALSNKN